MPLYFPPRHAQVGGGDSPQTAPLQADEPCQPTTATSPRSGGLSLVRRLLKRASFTSVEELKARLLAFIEYFNNTMAKPFKWTYTGHALVV